MTGRVISDMFSCPCVFAPGLNTMYIVLPTILPHSKPQEISSLDQMFACLTNSSICPIRRSYIFNGVIVCLSQLLSETYYTFKDVFILPNSLLIQYIHVIFDVTFFWLEAEDKEAFMLRYAFSAALNAMYLELGLLHYENYVLCPIFFLSSRSWHVFVLMLSILIVMKIYERQTLSRGWYKVAYSHSNIILLLI